MTVIAREQTTHTKMSAIAENTRLRRPLYHQELSIFDENNIKYLKKQSDRIIALVIDKISSNPYSHSVSQTFLSMTTELDYGNLQPVIDECIEMAYFEMVEKSTSEGYIFDVIGLNPNIIDNQPEIQVAQGIERNKWFRAHKSALIRNVADRIYVELLAETKYRLLPPANAWVMNNPESDRIGGNSEVTNVR